MPAKLWRGTFRFWLSVLVADPDTRRGVKRLLVAYDDAYRAVDQAAIRYDDGVHVKHRLTHYHDFFTERVTDLSQTYSVTIQQVQQSLQEDQSTRAARVQELRTRIDKLNELLRRVEVAEQRL